MSIKEDLFAACMKYAETRIEAARLAITFAQTSANEETKSSAGDKYETGRAMAQLEIENGTAQLAAATKLKRTLELINPESPTTRGQAGSLIYTSQGIYYLAISAGQLTCGGLTYYAVSVESPIGVALMGVTKGMTIRFKENAILINEVA